MIPFERIFQARWADMDFNGHVRNTAYLDMSGDVRMMYFHDHGVAATEFARLGIGPVIVRDEVEYRREFRLLDSIRVTLAAVGRTEDGSRFRLRNRFFHTDGTEAAAVTSTGGWLDLRARKFTTPPMALLAAMYAMPQEDDYALLPAGGR